MLAGSQVSFVLATRNRCRVTLETLRQVFSCARPSVDFEVIVVDNASTDGTPEAIRAGFPQVVLLAQRRNLGSCAKALGVDQARGEYVVFLDDDSCPRPGAVDRMIQHFWADGRLGAAGFRVHLPDGRQECSAFPDVFIGCGVGFRTAALRQVGGLDRTLFMQAEEYDLSFRLVNAGWQVRTFDDLHVDHLKTPCARRSGRTVYCDTRNNLLVVARYLPDRPYPVYRQDWLQRYAWLAGNDGRRAAFYGGVMAGRLGGVQDRRRYRDRRLSPEAFETLFRFRFVERRMKSLAASGVERVTFADLGKNAYAFLRAARKCGISVLSIGDDRFAAPGRRYRGLPLEPLAAAMEGDSDAVVVANTSPVHSDRTRQRLADLTDRTVHCWFGHESGPEAPEIGSTAPQRIADKTRAADVAAVGG
ncbi:MAG TPA: glycosyltransferase [Phycisphaerae bacterium]|nr:glycosyltransferase [Phycisphaerae bacterium]